MSPREQLTLPLPARGGKSAPTAERAFAEQRFRARPPVLLVPWGENFLNALLERVLEDTGGDAQRACFIFPHSRPQKYLMRLLGAHPGVRRPLTVPSCHTVSGLFSALRRRLANAPAWEAGLLDRVGLLLECVRREGAAGDFGAGAGGPEAYGSGAHGPDARGAEEAYGNVPGADMFSAQGPHPRGSGPRHGDARHFFPWGERLAALFEECFAQRRVPADLPYAEGRVTPYAARLLEKLSGIFARYAEGLRERGWTTPGFDAAGVCDHLAATGNLPGFPLAGERIYIAGFHALTAAEDALFRHLWQRGATLLIHADPALLEKGGEHWSCSLFREQARRWGARLELYSPARGAEFPAGGGKAALPAADGTDSPRPRIRCFEGFDLHSQLAVLREELAADLPAAGAGNPDGSAAEAGNPDGSAAEARNAHSAGTGRSEGSADAGHKDLSAPSGRGGFSSVAGPEEFSADTAVALPDSGLLLPALHHLPHADVNISMGYPLTRSPLFRLLDTILRMQENKRGSGYHWRDLVELVRHPYLKMLRPPPLDASSPLPPDSPPSSSADELRRELHRFEEALRESGGRYARPFELLERVYTLLGPEEMPPPEVLALVEKVFARTVEAFENPLTPADMGRAVAGLCGLLLEHGSGLWKRFPIDAECLYRLMRSVAPELMRSALAEEPFAPGALFSLTRRLMEAERVPFEADPLVGLQVLGMLETRLLTFRRVVVLEAVEDALPGSPAGDPLLPEPLRRELGLPDLAARERAAAYTFFRLLAGARDVVLLYQEGTGGGLQDRKKKKSRFVEELLWEEEKRLGRLLRPQGGDGPLTVLESSLSPPARGYAATPVTPPVRALVDERLKHPVSASFLDAYLRCPLQWYLERIAGLAPAREAPETADPLAVGDLFHSVLQEFYQPLLGLPLPAGENMPESALEELTAAFFSHPRYLELRRTLPADSLAMLETAARHRLAEYLRRQPATTVAGLEARLFAPFAAGGREYQLYGILDRIDRRIAEGDGPDTARTDACGTRHGGFAPDGMEGCGAEYATKDGGVAEEHGAAPGDGAGEVYGPAEHQDRRSAVILDYKTGGLPRSSPFLWDDEALWRQLEERLAADLVTGPDARKDAEPVGGPDAQNGAEPGGGPDEHKDGSDGGPDLRAHSAPCSGENADPLFARLSRDLGSVQLPFYLLLYSLAREKGLPPAVPGPHPPALDAAWVALADTGEETPLFRPGMGNAEKSFAITRRIPLLIRFLLRHMAENDSFRPLPGKHCLWCSCRGMCMVCFPTQ